MPGGPIAVSRTAHPRGPGVRRGEIKQERAAFRPCVGAAFVSGAWHETEICGQGPGDERWPVDVR